MNCKSTRWIDQNSMFLRVGCAGRASMAHMIPRGPFVARMMPMVSTLSSRGAKVSQPRFYLLSTEGEAVDGKVDQVSDTEYSTLANEYLETITDELEELSDEFPQIDAELSQGVMNISLPPHGDYVINKQPPNKQIWFSSPITGPKRYDLIGGNWITLRDNTSLTAALEAEISSAIGREFKFEGVDS